MKKTTIAIIAILALMLIGETILMLVLHSTGRPSPRIDEPEGTHSLYVHKEKIELNIGEGEQWVTLRADGSQRGDLSTDSIYCPDTLIIIGQDVKVILAD